jgi:hypothetical protein
VGDADGTWKILFKDDLSGVSTSVSLVIKNSSSPGAVRPAVSVTPRLFSYMSALTRGTTSAGGECQLLAWVPALTPTRIFTGGAA